MYHIYSDKHPYFNKQPLTVLSFNLIYNSNQGFLEDFVLGGNGSYRRGGGRVAVRAEQSSFRLLGGGGGQFF